MANPLEPAILPKVLANYATWAKVAAAVDAILPPEIQDDRRTNYIARLAPNDLNDVPKLYRALVDDLVANGRLDTFVSALFNQSQGNFILREILQRTVAVDDQGCVSPDALQSIRNGTEPFLNSQTFFEGMEAARYRVCAIWVDDGREPAGIKGTGFLIAPDLVLTARHVVEGLLDYGPAAMVGGKLVAPVVAKTGSEARLAFAFDYWTPSSNFRLDAPPPGVSIVRPAQAWLEWSSSKHPGDGITHVFGPPDVHECLDCAVIRLARRVGAAVAGNSGSRLRGWVHLDGNPPRLANGNAIAILQHPAGGPQVFDKGNYKEEEPGQTRIWYETETSEGSSGSPCFDSDPTLVAFHNAGRPKNFHGPTETCNQGVRIDQVIAAMPKPLLDESQKGWSRETALWSLSDDPAAPEPVLDRVQFKDWIVELFGLHPRQRVVIVEQAPDVSAIGKSGKSFSTRILKALARGRSGFVVEFSAREVRSMAPEQFLMELGRRIGITEFGVLPEKPADERQMTRWWASDLPQWFGQLLEDRARKAGTAALVDQAKPGESGSALGREHVLRELVWIVIDDIHLYPPEGGIEELIAGMMGITDTASLVGPGLKSLRWLIIGHIPDFVRERSIEYVRDEVSQKRMGEAEWVECLATAFLSMGRQDEFNAATARSIYQFSKIAIPDIANPVLTLKALASAVPSAIKAMRLQAGGS